MKYSGANVMNDRELLELAAKSAGLQIQERLQAERDAAGYGNIGLYIVNLTTCWNPLESDADAFRLMVDLGIDVHFRCTGTYTNTESMQEEFFEPKHNDPSAATRRAITRAAAAVGKERK